MLRLPCKITFGTFDRFMATEFVSDRDGSITIFVHDNHAIDDITGLSAIILQENAEAIPDIATLIAKVKKMHPFNFIVTNAAVQYENRREAMKFLSN